MSRQASPEVSVIIPFYNTGHYLQRCVESVTGQTYTDLEILLVDDGSSDGSVQIAEKLAEKDGRIRLLKRVHAGVSAARNAGLAEASGNCILFLDSDDWMKRTIIGDMVCLMERENADLVTCELMFSSSADDTGKEEGQLCGDKETKPAVSIYTREEYLRLFFRIDSNEWVHFPVAKLYKRELLPQQLYPEGIRVGEDVAGTYKSLTSVRKIVRIREVGYYYYQNPQSVTMSYSEKDFDLLRVWDQMLGLTESREPDHSYAEINRNRVNFTLLFRMITEVPAAEIRRSYRTQQKQLRADLCRCEKELLGSPIVASRKVLIRLLCHAWPLMEMGGDLYVRCCRILGKQPGVTRRKLS